MNNQNKNVPAEDGEGINNPDWNPKDNTTHLQPVKDEGVIKKIAWAAWKEVYILNTSYPDINDPDKPQEYDWSWMYDSEFTTWWDAVGKKFLHTADMGNPVTELSYPPEPANNCICDNCNKPYFLDVSVKYELWPKISPRKIDGWKSGGLLCPQCIVDKIQNLISEPASKEQEGNQDELWKEVVEIADGYIVDFAVSSFETDYGIGGGVIDELKQKFKLYKKKP